MPVVIKSLEQLRDQVLNDIESNTNQSTPAIDIAYNRTLANGQGSLALLNQLYALDRQSECFPQTASEDGLSIHAELKNTPRETSTQSVMKALVIGTVGTVIGTYSVGPMWSNGDYTYQTSVGGTIGSTGELEITIISDDAGEKTVLSVDQVISLTSAISTLNNDATITSVEITGEEQQGLESWREAIVRAYAFPPNVGTASYFHDKSFEIDGITRCFPYVDEDYVGKVLLYLTDDSKTGGTPSDTQLEAIEELFTEADSNVMWSSYYLYDGQKRINAYASTVEAFTVTVQDGVPALSDTLKTSIQKAIENYFYQREPYINGLSLYNYGYVSKTDLVSVAQNAVNSQTGSTGRFVELEVVKDSSGLSQDLFTLEKGQRASSSVVFA